MFSELKEGCCRVNAGRIEREFIATKLKGEGK
jgi:hypothetical protein